MPANLGQMLRLGRRGVISREGEMYCNMCEEKEVGGLTHLYGQLIASDTLGILYDLAKAHDESHTITIVDRDNCQMGM